VVSNDRHPLSVHRMAPDAVLDAPAVPCRNAIHRREVELGEIARAEGIAEPCVGEIMLGHDHAAAGFPVEAMNDAGAEFATDAAEVFAMEKERVDQGAIRVACRRMHYHAVSLVEHDEVLILEEDVEREVLRDDLGGLGFRN